MKKARRISDLFSSVAPYLGAGLLLLGIVRMCLYYSYFGINIVNFIELSEIILSLLDLGVGFVIALVCVLICFVAVVVYGNLVNKNGKISLALEVKTDARERYFFPLLILVFWILGLIDGTDHPLILLGILIVTIIALVFLTVHIWSMNERKPRTGNGVLFYALCFATCVTITIASAVKSIHSVRYDLRYYGTTIELEGQPPIVSDSTHYYIGKCKNYLFVYHQTEKMTEVIPMSSVQKITLVVDTLTPLICPPPDAPIAALEKK
jgi:hypothetical protein